MTKNYLVAESIDSSKYSNLYMTFNLSGRRYSVLADQISEVIQLPALTIPEKMPQNIVGLLNLRGNIINITDIRGFLGLEKEPYNADHQVLIVNINEKLFGLIVDSVEDVCPFEHSKFESLPYSNENKFITNVYQHSDNIVAVLSLDEVHNKLEQCFSEQAEQDAVNTKNLFPTDEISKRKFLKRAENLQKKIKVELSKNDYTEDKFVSFSLNEETYCISLKYVKEFTKVKNITLTPVPCVPDFIIGLVNLRGEFLTIIDIKNFLGIQKSTISDKTKIIVIKSPNMQIGILVDDVFDMVNIPLETINQDHSEKNKFILGELILDNQKVINVLNLQRIIEDERLFFEDAV